MSSLDIYNKYLKTIVKVLFDDISYQVINYIIIKLNEGLRLVDEQKITQDLNLGYNQIRQSLIKLRSQGIIVMQEHKNKKEDIIKDNTNSNYNNYSKQHKKNKTSDVYINEDYIEILHLRFQLLTKNINKRIKESETQKYKCNECSNIYEEHEYAFQNHRCKNCFNKPLLTKLDIQSKGDIKKYVNIILSKLEEIITISKTEYNNYKKEKTETLANNNTNNKLLNRKMNQNINNNNTTFVSNPIKRLNFDSVNDEEINLKLNEIHNNEQKWKVFKHLFLNYVNGNLKI